MNTPGTLSRKLEAALLVALVAVALAPRFWCFAHNAIPEGDAGNYLEVGRNLASGRGYVTYAKWDFYGEPAPVVHPEGNRQPLVPLIAAATFKLGATSPTATRVVTLVASLAFILLVYALFRRWLGPALALAGAAFVAVEPAFLWFSTRVQTECYFVLFFAAAMFVAGRFDEEKPSPVRPLVVGALLGLAYLTRLNGVLLLAAYVVALVIFYKGRGVAYSLLAVGAFALVALPWFIRNAAAFGDPFYSQAKYFVIAANFDDVWAVKRTVPSWSNFFATYGVGGIALRYVRGLWRGLEPLFLGNLHFNEPYQGAPLAAFAVLAVFVGPALKRRRALVFPALALGLHLLAFALYGQGLYRYFLPFYVLIIPLGVAAAWTIATNAAPRPRFVRWVLIALLAVPFVRPLGKTLAYDDRAEYKELSAAATWIKENTAPGEVVVTWPRVIEFLYDYDRPSLYWPAGPWNDVMWVLHSYEVKYVVVEPTALAARPNLLTMWAVGPGGVRLVPPGESQRRDLVVRLDYGTDAFSEVYRSEEGDLAIYQVNLDKVRQFIYSILLGTR